MVKNAKMSDMTKEIIPEIFRNNENVLFIKNSYGLDSDKLNYNCSFPQSGVEDFFKKFYFPLSLLSPFTAFSIRSIFIHKQTRGAINEKDT